MTNGPSRKLSGLWTLGHSKFMDIVHEIESSSSRVTIVVGVALIDDCLTDALSASSAIQEKAFIARCWGEHSSIRDFSQKIDLAACFGIYGLVTHRDLLRLRDMRNEAAHKSRTKAFESARIKGLCRDLVLPDWQSQKRATRVHSDPRDRFIATVSLTTDFLMIWTHVLRSGDGRKRPSVRLP